jgi:hypothetical protein
MICRKKKIEKDDGRVDSGLPYEFVAIDLERSVPNAATVNVEHYHA